MIHLLWTLAVSGVVLALGLSLLLRWLGAAGLPAPCAVPASAPRGCEVSRRELLHVFSAALLPELEALTGDQGGRVVLRRHWDLCVLIPVEDPLELADADTPEALLALRQGESDTFEPS